MSDNNFHLLITDDESEILELLTLYLRNSVDKIFRASNGKEGLEVLANEKIDLVLSDISMPEMTGIEFLKALREKGDETPFIFISAYGQQKTNLESMGLEFSEFIVKPVTKKVIVEVLERTRKGRAYNSFKL